MRVLRYVLVGFLLGLMVGWLWPRRTDDVPESTDSRIRTPRPQDRRVTPPDNLTDLKGIGPAYAQALNAIGIQSFEQLARQDVDSLAARLTMVRVSAARIRRDRWIEQAAERGQPRRSVWSGNDNGRSTKIGYTE